MNDDFDIEDVLRASLAERARKAPDGNQLAERIIAEADHPGWVHEPRGPRHWRGWMLPAVAAASVIAVVATIVGLVQLKHSDKHAADADQQRSGRTATASQNPTDQPSLLATGPTSGSSPSVGKMGGDVPDKFRVVDLTFVANHAWALGQGDCLDGTPGQCDAVLRSDDDGKNWVSTPNPPAQVRAACDVTPCVDHLRFADQHVGYAFGPGALFLTNDGGQTWKPDNGGDTTSLEVANGTALRVTADRLEIASVGTLSWKAAALPTKATVRAPVVRALSRAYVSAANGDTLYASTDNGTRWTPHASPCPTSGSLNSVTAAADGSLVVMCISSGSKAPTLMVSADDGSNFTPVTGVPADSAGRPFAAIDSSTVFCSVPGQLVRTTDSGQQWTRVATDKTTGAAKGAAGFLGFESPTTGRWVSADGSTIYTTTDGGNNWSHQTFK